MATKILRPYQRAAFDDLSQWIVAGERDLLLESPVGSGKTTTVKALAAERLAAGLRLAVVLVPQRLLREQWADAGRYKIGRKIYALPATVPVEARVMNLAWWRAAQGVVVTTRQGFTQLGAKLPKALDGVLIVADEGHHCADTTKGAQALAIARKRGAATLLVSATPWATAGEVGGATTKAHRLPDAEYVTSFEADDPSRPPSEYAIDIVRVGKATTDPRLTIDDSVSARRAKGPATAAEEAHAKKICGAMAKRWAADGFPRTVMNVPRVFWREHLRRALARAWKAAHGGAPDLVDLIGDEVDPVAHGRLKADSEARRWSDVKVNAVLSCARMDEGLDWVPCSHVYNAGIPSVAGLILQRWGRAARAKRRIDGYPEEHAGARTLVFFTPPGKGTDKGWGKQIETAWILAGCIADYQIMRDWIEERRARGERGPLPVPPTSPAVAEWTGRLAAHVAARGGEMAPADARAWLAAQKKPPEPAVIDAVVRRMQAANARHRAAEEARTSGGLKVRADRKADAEPLIEDFEAPLCANISSIIKMTALDVSAVASKLHHRAPPWLGMPRAVIESFAARALARVAARDGAHPVTSSEISEPELGGYTWAGLSAAMRRVGSSMRLVGGAKTQPRHSTLIRIADFYRTHGHQPSASSPAVEERKLGQKVSWLRRKHPDECKAYGIPLEGDRSAAMRRHRADPAKHVFKPKVGK